MVVVVVVVVDDDVVGTDHVSGNTDDYDGDVEFATDDEYGNESFETNADKYKYLFVLYSSHN